MQESLGGQDMDEAGTSENGPRQPLHPLPTRASLADRLPPRPSELLKVYCWLMRSSCNSTAAYNVRILLPVRFINAEDWVQACRPLQSFCGKEYALQSVHKHHLFCRLACLPDNHEWRAWSHLCCALAGCR